MNWDLYRTSVEDYLRLIERYYLNFEYMDGISLKDGTSVILLGGVAPEGTLPESALVVISNVTLEEMEKLNTFVEGLRAGTKSEGK